jgi:hypothetical protein
VTRVVLQPILDVVDELARDVGTLRRRFASNGDAWTGAYIADRLAANIEAVDVMLQPSAAELAAIVAPGDPDAIDAALEHVARRSRELRRQLGKTPP